MSRSAPFLQPLIARLLEKGEMDWRDEKPKVKLAFFFLLPESEDGIADGKYVVHS